MISNKSISEAFASISFDRLLPMVSLPNLKLHLFFFVNYKEIGLGKCSFQVHQIFSSLFHCLRDDMYPIAIILHN